MLPTTRKQSAAFPEVAQIRKGGAKENNRVGKDLNDHFRVVFFPGTDDAQGEFLNAYKTLTPTRIRAMVPFRSVWQAWRCYNEAYNAGRMIAQADDDRYITLRDPITGAYQVRDSEPFRKFSPGETVDYDRDGKHYSLKIKTYGNLKLFLPEIGRLVSFTLKTTSFYDRLSVESNLAAIEALAETLNAGNAAGIPFYVYRTLREIRWNKPDGSAQRVSKWLITIEADRDWVAQAIRRLSSLALTGNTMPMLTPGDVPALTGEIDPDETDEPETEPEPPAPEAKPQAATPLQRPYPPEVVREKLTALVNGDHSNRPSSEAQRNLLRLLLEECFAGDNDAGEKRRAVTRYLTGFESSKEISGGWVYAMLSLWLKPTLDSGGKYHAHAFSIQEAQAIYRQSLIDDGQQTLKI